MGWRMIGFLEWGIIMAGSTFDSRLAFVGNLLSTNTRERIIVPEFQRGYEWEEKHVRAFWADIMSFLSERGNTGAPSKYFLGPIVVFDQKDPIELLDGQQRLATITMLLSVIRDAATAIPGKIAEDFAKDT